MKPIDFADLYRDGRHYDLQNSAWTEDIPFLERQIKHYGEPVLELACGTGRITIPLAEKGIEITGLDLTEPMLAQAQKKAAARNLQIKWVLADCRTFRIPQSFRVIIFPFNSIGHLHDRESIEACFARVREHLTDDGRFIIDMFNPDLKILTRGPQERFSVGEYLDPDGYGPVTITESNEYNAKKQINRITWRYRLKEHQTERVVHWGVRIFYPQEFDALLHYNGFTIENKYGTYDEQPFTATSPKQLIVCRLA